MPGEEHFLFVTPGQKLSSCWTRWKSVKRSLLYQSFAVERCIRGRENVVCNLNYLVSEKRLVKSDNLVESIGHVWNETGCLYRKFYFKMCCTTRAAIKSRAFIIGNFSEIFRVEVKMSCDFIAVFAQRNETNKQFLFIRFLRAVETLRNGSATLLRKS